MRLVLLLLFMPLVVIFAGILFFSSLWTRHQEDHSPESEDVRPR